MLQARSATVKFPETEMEYIRFGSGEKILIMLPGLGDGLRTMKGTALPFAMMYRKFASDYTVYAFSRKNRLPQGYTTRDMARDLRRAMMALNIPKADLFGVSMGGMIAQHFAADYPDLVNRLVLVVTAAGSNPILTEAVQEWIGQAKDGDHTALMDSNLRRIYTDAYYQKNKALIPIIGRLTKPRSYDRFLVQAEACLRHDSREQLAKITALTLVIGGEQDQTLGGEASREIARHIAGSQLYLYPDQGHGLYEEAPDFNDRVLSFLKGGTPV